MNTATALVAAVDLTKQSTERACRRHDATRVHWMITDYGFFRVRRLTPALGGEGTSLDFGIEVSDCFAAALREALWAHGVLVFHDLTITQEQQKTLARVFGDLHRHPVAGARGEDPYTSLVIADKNTVVVSGQDWHVDVSCEERPPIVSVLYLSEAPAIGCGGDTVFCSSSAVTAAARLPGHFDSRT